MNKTEKILRIEILHQTFPVEPRSERFHVVFRISEQPESAIMERAIQRYNTQKSAEDLHVKMASYPAIHDSFAEFYLRGSMKSEDFVPIVTTATTFVWVCKAVMKLNEYIAEICAEEGSPEDSEADSEENSPPTEDLFKSL